MPYTVTLITPEKKEELVRNCTPQIRYEIKSGIFGCCIKVLTDNRTLAGTWQENFFSISPDIRSHGRLYVLPEKTFPENTVLFDPYTKTVFLFNVSYYGWVKSVALGLCGDILEDEHGIGSVHGACVDIGGRGICVVGTSGAGKTTQTYGMLRDPRARIISDDWFFTRVFGPEILAYGSEKNFYIRQDLSAVWKEYAGLVAAEEYDADGRAVADIRWVIGKGRMLPLTTLAAVVVLRRDPADTRIARQLEKDEAFSLFTKNNSFNPHLLVKDARKETMRMQYLNDLLDRLPFYLVNTTGTPEDTQKAIRTVMGLPGN
jgi:Serine kinase of the HPr protein, regulates carbohydrate metabolism